MFKKVLIAEDHELTNISVQKTLDELGIADTRYVYYCDDAFTWIRNAIKAGQPYDLLITDLYFEEDHCKQALVDGKALIQAAREVQPELKVIVFSAENRAPIVDNLFKTLSIDAYVRKARRDAQSLKQAIHAVYQHHTYLSPDLKQTVKAGNSYEFTTFDVTIIKLLSQGVLQKDIPYYLQQKNIKPSGLSSVEKRLNLIKEVLDFSNNEQLIAYCKDIDII
ncbi:DNA-binding response regulator, NarL/FixJ family, contains REC and HTH domains [Parapedobacter composti]|uniref:DNA-binding response regulator, NarL/FixJ family, contains REC and HTH domains n=1 Tax=Parapedobacter composti TaxID=623281 RepID=A0A1I1LKZ7_9SPHI|nr:response regulator [Parapedobacter composti]SFC73709.1 DNA-binding response regulator, NarL/FixJ family, contains REC and HTH domains [Parapedobacter composti]